MRAHSTTNIILLRMFVWISWSRPFCSHSHSNSRSLARSLAWSFNKFNIILSLSLALWASSFVRVCLHVCVCVVKSGMKHFLNQLKSIRPRNGNRNTNNGNVAYFPVTILYVFFVQSTNTKWCTCMCSVWWSRRVLSNVFC